MTKKSPIKVAITGGAGQIAYSLLFRIASGEVFGSDQPVILQILEIPEALKSLEGVVMELDDCSFPTLNGVNIGSDATEVFNDVNLALLVGAKPRGPGMERKDLLSENGKIFIKQGEALNKASADLKVLVVGNPCNTNCYITMKHAKDVPQDRFFAMTRLDQNRARCQLAKKTQNPVASVSKVTIWGNHSATQVPDFHNAMINGERASHVIKDEKWLEGDFLTKIQKRGAEVIAARGKSSAASAANGIIDAVKDLYFPTPDEETFSMAIHSKGNPYGIDEDLIFSFPCITTKSGEIQIVSGLEITPFLKEKIMASEAELVEERSLVKDLV